MQLTDTGNLKSKWLPGSLILLGVIVIALALIADQFGLGGIQGFGPNQISMLFSGIALLIAGLIVNSTESYHNLWFWVLLLVGVVIVAQAADLLILGGLPGFLVKQLAVGVLILGVALPGSISGTRTEGGNLLAWLRSVLVEKIQIGKFLAISVQLVLLLLLIRQFELENQAFYNNLMLLVLYGFFIHYFLPGQYRLPFFFFLSLAAIAGIFGLGNGIWLVGIGLVLIAISHLPISFNLRVVLLILVGAGLVVLRMEVFQSPIPGIIWPVLGSMFMFRMIIYMYDLRHEKDHNLWRTLSYFFLLPNVVFPFFPIVDYAAFRRTYFNKEQFRIYQTGVEWIFRGVVHLIFYRFVNYYLVLAPEQVHTAPQLAIFVISNFLLYVRVSGQFHIIVGLLHLFGFNLPETFHKYFLSTSFTEMWRRFNIYWKDFMQKIIYNPTYMRLRKLGTTAAILLATLWIFILMWLLHTYQWFWLRGTVVVTPQDGLFRLSLAALMIGNTYIELKRGRKRSLGGESWNLREMAGSALRAAGVFTTMCILWSLWTGGSIADWLNLWSIAGESLQNILILLAIFAGIVGVLFLALLFEKATDRILKFSPNDNAIFKPAVLNGSLIALVLFISTPTVLNRIGGSAQAFIEDLKVSRLSDRDAEILRRGYYEDLMGVNRFNPDLWDIYTKRPTDWPLLQDTELARLTNDFRIIEIAPSKSIIYHNERFSTNEWGFRDKSYTKTPPPNTYRIALVGPSYVMGSGVADDQTFEWLLEDKLNSERAGSPYAGYEILNFGTAGHSALQELYTLETRALDFKPNAVFYVAHQLEEEVIVRNLAGNIRNGAEIPYEYLNTLIAQEGLTADMSQEELERGLQPHGLELVAWTYQKIDEVAKANGILPVWIYIPALELPSSPEFTAQIMRLADEAGFVTIDLENVYADQDVSKLIVAEWDKHPNAKGHQLIAKALYDALLERSDLIPLGLTPGNSTP